MNENYSEEFRVVIEKDIKCLEKWFSPPIIHLGERLFSLGDLIEGLFKDS